MKMVGHRIESIYSRSITDEKDLQEAAKKLDASHVDHRSKLTIVK